MKHLDIEDMLVISANKNISTEIINLIGGQIRQAELADGIYIDEVRIEPLSKKPGATPLMQIEPVPQGKQAGVFLILNQDVVSGTSLADLDERIRKTDWNIAQNLKEATIHEIGHVKLIWGRSIQEIHELYKELADKGIKEISAIAAEDGAEAIAEIEILLHRGEPLSEEAERLYSTYVRRTNK